MSSKECILTLADGTWLTLHAGDAEAVRVVSFFAEAARLAPAPATLPPGARRLLAMTEDHGQRSSATTEASVVCPLEPSDAPRSRRVRRVAGPGIVAPIPEPFTEEQWFWQQLVRLSACIARETQPRGGVLLHSGLAQAPHLRCGAGILLAGRSGVGKSTASTRLPLPWRSLADDVTLVVRDGGGVYWAHPWPTWSWFFGKEDHRPGGGTWDVQQAVPLRAIFVLEQGDEDRAEPLGPGHAVALLAELARQTSQWLPRGTPLDEVVAFNLQRFENLCALVQAVPTYLLHVSLNGAFWTEIERVMCEGEDQRDQ